MRVLLQLPTNRYMVGYFYIIKLFRSTFMWHLWVFCVIKSNWNFKIVKRFLVMLADTPVSKIWLNLVLSSPHSLSHFVKPTFLVSGRSKMWEFVSRISHTYTYRGLEDRKNCCLYYMLFTSNDSDCL